jgi:hypothetical protein
MSEIGKTLTKFVFYLVAIVLLFWTASLTVTFVAAALPTMPWYVPYLSLVVFDGGMIAWLFVFLKYAQGTIQRATALGLTGFNFIGVGLLVIAEILLGGQTLTAAPENIGTWAIYGIGVWTVVNVFGVLLFHIGAPEAQVQMSIQNEKDAIFRGALANLAERRVENSKALAGELGARMYDSMLAELFVDKNGDGTADLLQSGRNEGVTVPGTASSASPAFATVTYPVDDPQPQPTAENRTAVTKRQASPFTLPPHGYNLDALLSNAGYTRKQARDMLVKYNRTTARGAYEGLKMLDKIPDGMTPEDFAPLFDELMRDEQMRPLSGTRK